MKQTTSFKKACSFLTLLILTLFTLQTENLRAADVCSEGLGIPPFLEAGADPNLLLALDNSGSMLDTAWVPTETNKKGECVDDSFDSTIEYIGLFDSQKWYEWTDGAPQWRNGSTYAIEDFVYSAGMFYKATTAGLSSGVDIASSEGVTWENVSEIPVWTYGAAYDPESFVQHNNQLFYTLNGKLAYTPPDLPVLPDISADPDWVPVDSTWRPTTTYTKNSVVSDHGVLFRRIDGGTSLDVGVANDNDITGNVWERLDGYFEQMDSVTTSSEAETVLSESIGIAYKGGDLFIQVVTNVDDILTGVVAFAARGNLLNWASASKFDIQKKILTGGKYSKTENLLVSEGRGCSKHGFVKEVELSESAPPNHKAMITFSIRGFKEKDWVDTTDDTTRIDILGISGTGFIAGRGTACQEAIDFILDGKLGSSKAPLKECLAYTDNQNNVYANSNSAFNNSLHECWFYDKQDYTYEQFFTHGDISEYLNSCSGIYTEVDPAAIDYEDTGYICAGFYNDSIPVTAYHPDPDQGQARTGYIGRCWDTANNGWGDDANVEIGGETNRCIRDAIWDYCGFLQVAQVIDPTDLVLSTGETWGIVGALIDSGVDLMFEDNNHPLIVMKGFINFIPPPNSPPEPEGIIHEVAEDLRIGVMAFNAHGSKTECGQLDTSPNVDEYCPEGDLDGARIIAPIQNGDLITDIDTDTRHVDNLTVAINEVRASSWTPLSEAIYNALGYYGQNTSRRLSDSDFILAKDSDDNQWADPVQYWCQQNYILVITEGSSTADISDKVTDMVAGTTMITGIGDDDGTVLAADEGQCSSDDLYSSTFLDDLTYFGKNAAVSTLYATPEGDHVGQLHGDDLIWHDKQNITTYMVIAGEPRNAVVEEGSNPECNPYTLMKNAATNGGTTMLTGENPGQLEANLRAALSDILFRASAGSASSVISSSRSGEGGVYQAVFWPKIARGIGEDPLVWVGDVHAFFIDENGLLWDDYSTNRTDGKVGELWSEDINGNGKLDVGEDSNENSVLDGDRRITTFYNNTTNSTQICFNSSVIENGVCAASDYFSTPAEAIELRDFKYYIWSASQQLSNISDNDIKTNRGILADGTWDFSENQRYIFTWNDIDNDGIVDTNNSDQEEVLQFQIDPDPDNSNSTNYLNSTKVIPSSRNDLLSDFNVSTDDELEKLVNWLRGEEIYEPIVTGSFTPNEPTEDLNDNGIRDTIYRCRKYPDCDYNALNSPPWRLGDIIHSTPTVVSRPAERYHFPYKDTGYFEFYKKYVERRNVIYFGANDGMLHAVNGGFTDAGSNKFIANKTSTAYPALGDELWAYIPYNLQPHLSCLTDQEYIHKYFVDAPPRIFDVRIFPADDVHVQGWGTILVGYMRFGGAPTLADDSTPITDNREFISSYFILDITDPERPPTLIAEMTMTNDDDKFDYGNGLVKKYADLGYTTPMPTVVPMRNQKGNSEWFLVLGNGPETIKGENSQQGKVAVVSLNALTGYTLDSPPDTGTNNTGYTTSLPLTRKAFRIPNKEFDSNSSYADFGILSIPVDSSNGSSSSFVGDLVTVDFDLDTPSVPDLGIPYKGDVVYFGTVDGVGFDSTGTYWNGDGRMFRLLTNPTGLTNTEGYQLFTYPKDWQLKKLLDAQAPITAAPNIAFDGDNYWTYFGTGRFYAPEDKTDDSLQYFFGVKEPRDSSCEFTWNEIQWFPPSLSPANPSGMQGLLRTDQIRVIESAAGLWTDDDDYIYCENDDCDPLNSSFSLSSLPLASFSLTDKATTIASSEIYYKFSDLVSYIKGERCGTTDKPEIGIDGWYRQLNDPRERSLGMPTLLGGLTTFTTYQPFLDICQAEGVSNLYGVYYLTGTAWYENVFGTDPNDEGKEVVRDRLDLGKGLATTPSLQVGSGPHDAKAFIQTSTGEIVEVTQDNLPIQEFKSGRTSWRSE